MPMTLRMWRSALIWIAIGLLVALVVTLFHLPERMECAAGKGRYVHCKHGLLDASVWGTQ